MFALLVFAAYLIANSSIFFSLLSRLFKFASFRKHILQLNDFVHPSNFALFRIYIFRFPSYQFENELSLSFVEIEQLFCQKGKKCFKNQSEKRLCAEIASTLYVTAKCFFPAPSWNIGSLVAHNHQRERATTQFRSVKFYSFITVCSRKEC